MQLRIRRSLFGGALAMLLVSAALGAPAALARPTATYSVTATNDNLSTPQGCRVTVIASWAHSTRVKYLQVNDYFNGSPGNATGLYTLGRATKKGTYTIYDFYGAFGTSVSYSVTVNFLDANQSQVGTATSSTTVSCP